MRIIFLLILLCICNRETTVKQNLCLADNFLHGVKTVTDCSPKRLLRIATPNQVEADVRSKDITIPINHITLHKYDQRLIEAHTVLFFLPKKTNVISADETCVRTVSIH